MNSEKELSILIPAFNEENTIADLLQYLQKSLSGACNYEILVIDDGSSDNTYSVASSISGVTVFRHPYNKGNGASVKTGIQKSKGEKIVIIDSDGQHDPKHIIEMLKLLDDFDLVVGARETFGIGRRGLGNTLVSRLASYLSGIHIPDLTSGFRAFKKDKMLEFVHILPNRFSLPSTSTLAFAVNGYDIKFIPIAAHARQGGKSGISVFKDGIKFIILIFRMISLFNPLKVYAPTSIILLIMGLFWSIKVYVMDTGGVSSVGTMLLLAGIVTFLFGLLASQVAETRMAVGKILRKNILEENKKA